MRKTDLTQMSDEQILKTAKMLKNSFILLIVVVIIMIIASIFGAMKNGIDFYSFLPLLFIPLLYLRWIVYSRIKKEAESRNMK